MIGTVEAAVRQMREQRIVYVLSLYEVRQELLDLQLWDAADRVTQRIRQMDRAVTSKQPVDRLRQIERRWTAEVERAG